MYDLNLPWYTEMPQNKESVLKLNLILNSFGFISSIDLVEKRYVWLAFGGTYSQEKKILTPYSYKITISDFSQVNYNPIPLEYLLSL